MNFDKRIQKWMNDYGTWFENPERMKDGQMTKNLYPFTKIFSPIRVNGVTIKNRLVMGPMGNISMAEETGRPNEKMIEYFIERAKGGVGLITSGLIMVSQKWDPTLTELGNLSYFPRINDSRTRFSGWRNIAEGCHNYGTQFFIQLSAGLGRVGSPECLLNKFKLPVSASWNPNFYMPSVPCRPLSTRKLKKIVSSFGQCAADSKAALIDGVYLHGHEGYFLEQMTNPAFNRRKLGRYSDWQKFGIDVVKEIRKRTGPKYPIMYRIDLSLALNETYGDKMNKVKTLKKFKNGRTIKQTLEYMKNLVAAGVDLFDVDLGCYDNWWLPHPPNGMPPGCYLEVSQIVKDYFKAEGVKSNQGLEVPIVAVGKLGYPDLAEKALREEKTDMIMLARPLLADPQWPNKAYAGKVDEICPCIGDQEGCINEFVEGGHPQCALNPRSAFEHKFTEVLPKAETPKKIAVIGAGPAGVMAATTAAKRGHEVYLYEKNSKAGGSLIPGGVPKMKFDVINYVNYLNRQIEIVSEKYNLTATFDKEITFDDIKKEQFDSVILANGAKPNVIPVEGFDKPNVVQAIDLLNNPEIAKDAQNVVVIGGGTVGSEVAHMLAYEGGKKVKIVEMLPHFMKGVCTANRGYMIHYLEEKGVELINCARLTKILDDSIEISRNVSSTVPDPYNTWEPLLPENIENPLAKPIKENFETQTIKTDLVVLAAGVRPDDSIYNKAVEEVIAPQILKIGDAFRFGRVFEATKAGYAIGREI